jgi:hypothetical protein
MSNDSERPFAKWQSPHHDKRILRELASGIVFRAAPFVEVRGIAKCKRTRNSNTELFNERYGLKSTVEAHVAPVNIGRLVRTCRTGFGSLVEGWFVAVRVWFVHSEGLSGIDLAPRFVPADSKSAALPRSVSGADAQATCTRTAATWWLFSGCLQTQPAHFSGDMDCSIPSAMQIDGCI